MVNKVVWRQFATFITREPSPVGSHCWGQTEGTTGAALCLPAAAVEVLPNFLLSFSHPLFYDSCHSNLEQALRSRSFGLHKKQGNQFTDVRAWLVLLQSRGSCLQIPRCPWDVWSPAEKGETDPNYFTAWKILCPLSSACVSKFFPGGTVT